MATLPSATNWTAACSADGRNLVVAAVPDGWIYISTNSGSTWMPTSGRGWTVASSADGTTLVAGLRSIDVSPDSATWMTTSAPEGYWPSVACSADGQTLVAAGLNLVYTSRNSGATWTPSGPSTNWQAVASSADGSTLVAVVGYPGGGIYISKSTPASLLNTGRSGANFVLSWIVPSTIFVLQQNLDLNTTNWTDVATIPILTNVQHQLRVPLSSISHFYRLKQM